MLMLNKWVQFKMNWEVFNMENDRVENGKYGLWGVAV